MESVLLSLQRIGVVAGLTYREAIRRRLLVIFLAGCALFMALGGGCVRSCRACKDLAMDSARQDYEQRLMAAGIPADQRAAMLAELDQQKAQQTEQENEQFKILLMTISYPSLMAWLFLLALFFTPFLALSDLRTSLHTLILARPVSRWEYLLGKYLAVMAMLIAAGLMLVVCYLVLMRISAREWGVELLPAMLIGLQGLALWTMLVFFLTIAIGRLPAVFVSLLPLGLSFVPAYFLLSGRSPESGWFQIAVYVLGYGLPQIGLNLFYGFTEILLTVPEMRSQLQDWNIGQIGNNMGAISMAINTVWLLALGAGAVALFKRRELDT